RFAEFDVVKRLNLSELRAIWSDHGSLTLDAADYKRIDASAEAVKRALATGGALYGVNTGFGKLATTRIEADKLEQLQRNLVLSHCCGVGADLPDRIVRVALALKVLTLAQGFSGVKRATVDALLKLLDARAYPVVPSQGSVGASGDLAPLAHLSAPLIGEGA